MILGNGGDRSKVSIRSIVRRTVPLGYRRTARLTLRELPALAKDLLPDFLDSFRQNPLPPPRLRFRAAGRSARALFLETGREARDNLISIFSASRDPGRSYPLWLDFGCGSGRVARHLSGTSTISELWGVDVDAEAVGWASGHLAGRFLPTPSHPPMPLPSETFDVVYAGSVFTHMDEESQLRWLADLHRVMRSGALLIASTHSPSLTWTRPDLSSDSLSELAGRGFLFAPGKGTFNDDGAFHSREYLMSTWGRFFGLMNYRQYALNKFQDLSAWKKW